MCDHKSRVTENDRRWLKKIRVEAFYCAECEGMVRMLPKPKKIRLEEKQEDDEAH